jgi:hypothetical protein
MGRKDERRCLAGSASLALRQTADARAGRRLWLGIGNSGFIDKDPFFNPLHKAGVIYCDDHKRLPPIFEFKAGASKPPNFDFDADEPTEAAFDFDEMDEEYFDSSKSQAGQDDGEDDVPY